MSGFATSYRVERMVPNPHDSCNCPNFLVNIGAVVDFTSPANAPSPDFARMEHSTAIMEDAGDAIEGAAASSVPLTEAGSSKTNKRARTDDRDEENNYDRRKRKRDFSESSMRHGSRGGSFGDNKRHKGGDMGRKAYL